MLVWNIAENKSCLIADIYSGGDENSVIADRPEFYFRWGRIFVHECLFT